MTTTTEEIERDLALGRRLLALSILFSLGLWALIGYAIAAVVGAL